MTSGSSLFSSFDDDDLLTDFTLQFLPIKAFEEKTRGWFESEISSTSLSPVSRIQTDGQIMSEGMSRHLIWNCLVNSGEEIKHLSAT